MEISHTLVNDIIQKGIEAGTKRGFPVAIAFVDENGRTRGVIRHADALWVTPEFAGLAGCCVGLNQINLHVPVGLGRGDAIPVVLSINGKSSNTVGRSATPPIASRAVLLLTTAAQATMAMRRMDVLPPAINRARRPCRPAAGRSARATISRRLCS